MGKRCLQLVLTLLPLMHDNFPNKLMGKIHAQQCLAFKMADTNACVLPVSAVQTTEPTSETLGEGHVM